MRSALNGLLAAAFALGSALAGVSPRAGRARLAGIIRAAYAGAVPFIGRTLDPDA